MKEREKYKKRANLNAPNGSQDIPFQSQEFEQDFLSFFKIAICRFLASFSIKYDVTDTILQDNEKLKMQYLKSLLFHLFETLQAVRTWQRNFASFQILLLWQLESKLLSIIKNKRSIVEAKVMFEK